MNLNLKAAIIRKYGSQANFSQAIKVDESVISRIIHGRRSLQSEDREKWANALEVRPEDLFQDN